MEVIDVCTIINCIVYKLKGDPVINYRKCKAEKNEIIVTIMPYYEKKFVIDPYLVDNNV